METQIGRSKGTGNFSGQSLNVKVQIQFFLILVISVLLIGKTVKAEVVDTVLTFNSNSIASWTPVDFNSDGTNDISFNFYGITPNGIGSFATFFLNVDGDGTNQVLAQGSSVVPLNPGTTISLTPISGTWLDVNSGPNVWTQSGLSGQTQGVGASGFGNYMGVRFSVGADWYYGWIRFGPIPNESSDASYLPSVLEFAYETMPNTPIVTPVPEPNFLALGFLIMTFLIGKNYLSKKLVT
jgi:hypothetical protein